MKQTKFNSLGIDFQYSVPDSTTEFDTLAKEAGACLEEATCNVVYRASLPWVRDIFLHGRVADTEKGITAIQGIDDITGIARKTKEVNRPTKDKPENKVEVPDETEGEYFKRVCAETGKKPEDFAAQLQSVADAIPFDPSAPEPKERKPKTLAKQYVEKVQELHKNGKVDKALSVIKKDLGQDRMDKFTEDVAAVQGDTAKTDELLGWLIKEHAEWIAANKKGY